MKNVKAKLVKPTMEDAYDMGANAAGMVVRRYKAPDQYMWRKSLSLFGVSNVKTEHDTRKIGEYSGIL